MSESLAAELRPDRFDRFVVVGETLVTAEATHRADGVLRGDDITVDEDVELSFAAGRRHNVDVERGSDLGGQTGRPRFVASGAAVQDLDVAHARDVSRS